MSQEHQYNALASSFLDLWQDRMTALLHDPEVVRLLLRLLQSMPVAGPFGENAHVAQSFRAAAGGTSHASDAGNAAVARLQQRIADLEKRIESLEKQSVVRKSGHPIRKRVAKTVKRPPTRTGGKRRGKAKAR